MTTVIEAVPGAGVTVGFTGRGLNVRPTETLCEERATDLETGEPLFVPVATGRVIILLFPSPSGAARLSDLLFSVLG